MPLRMPKGERKAALRSLRDQIPVNVYLDQLHCLATTGRIPIYSPNANGRHKFTGEYTEPDRGEQIAALRYMTDLAMTPIAKEASTPTLSLMDAATLLANAPRLGAQELLSACKGLEAPETIDAEVVTDDA